MTDKEAIPYRPGQVIVQLTELADLPPYEIVSRLSGIAYRGRDLESGLHIYEGPAGKEATTIKKLSRYRNLVEWAEPRDPVAERRRTHTKALEELVNNLDFLADRPADEYLTPLQETIAYLNRMKQEELADAIAVEARPGVKAGNPLLDEK